MAEINVLTFVCPEIRVGGSLRNPVFLHVVEEIIASELKNATSQSFCFTNPE